MWSRKELKSKARQAIKRNYIQTIIVCLIMAILVGTYNYSISFNQITSETNFDFKGMSNSEIVNSLITGITGESPEHKNESKALNATRGVLATIFNNATSSSSFLFGLLNSINQFFFNDRIMAGIIILIGAIIALLYWIFIGNILQVGESRFFLENRSYFKTRVNRVLYLFKIRRIWNVSIAMLLRDIYVILWSFTIIGGMIKFYSYRMVPFILAENPDIGRKEVFRLSRLMMNGNKWNTFKVDCSFLLWQMLSVMTSGIVGFLYVNPYTTAVNAELYMTLREKLITDGDGLAGNFNDEYLSVVQDQIGSEVYSSYPVHLYTIPEHSGRKWISTDYHRTYSFTTLVLLFFSYAVFGWLWEVLLELLTVGSFINRGVLFGPWLPIYGAGGILTLLLLRKWIDKPVNTFFLVIIICAVVEYFTGWYLEIFRGAKWWDYSGYLFHLHGRICLEGLLVFGLGGCAGIYLFAPILDNVFRKMSMKIRIALCILLVLLFSADLAYSVKHPNQGERITVESEEAEDLWANIQT